MAGETLDETGHVSGVDAIVANADLQVRLHPCLLNQLAPRRHHGCFSVIELSARQTPEPLSQGSGPPCQQHFAVMPDAG